MKKQPFILLTLIVLLTSTMALGYFFKASKRAVRVQSTSALKNIGAILKIEDIGTIRINDVQFDYISDEYNERWIYKDIKKNLTIIAWKEKIEDLLNDLKNFSQGRLVESQPSDIAKYGLAESDNQDKKPYTISLESKLGKKILNFTFSQSTNPTYARFEGDKSVYKVASTLHSALSSDTIYWLDTRIFTPNGSHSFVPSEVESITINSYQGRKLLMNKEIDHNKKKEKDENTDKWTAVDSSITLDSSKISRYLGSLVEAKAKDFSDVQVVDSMQEAEVLVKLKDGKEIGLILYTFADNFYVKKKIQDKNDFNQYTFLITKYLKDTLFPTSNEPFVAEHTPDPENTEEKKETE